MRLSIVEPADVSGVALAELKDWLGISRPNDDNLLAALLLTSLSVCEAFTGQTPMRQRVEERLAPRAGRYDLSSRPIVSVTSVEVVAQDGSRSPLSADAYSIDIKAARNACFDLISDVEGQAVAVSATVGIAQLWQDIPPSIRQGLIRLAAHYYRDRDRRPGARSDASPPTSVTALWGPFREKRLR